MNQASWTYLGQLTRALQQEGVEGHHAGEFVAEIDSHLAESGADPVAEFGPPSELAAELARRPGARRPGWVPPLWSLWLLLIPATMIAAVAFEALAFGRDDGRIAISAEGVLYPAILMPAAMWYGYLATRRLDGRSWAPVTGLTSALVALGIAIVTTTTAQMTANRVIATVPATVFWATAAVILPLLIAVYAWRNNPIRFPDHARYLKRLRWAPLFGQRVPRSLT